MADDDTQKALADRAASQTNDEVQAILRSRRKSGVPGGLGDSRAIRAAIYENLLRQMAITRPRWFLSNDLSSQPDHGLRVIGFLLAVRDGGYEGQNVEHVDVPEGTRFPRERAAHSHAHKLVRGRVENRAAA
jgi:hypothetical protein